MPASSKIPCKGEHFFILTHFLPGCVLKLHQLALAEHMSSARSSLPQQPSGRGEALPDCSILKAYNFFSEVQKWMLPSSNDDRCHSFANKTALGNWSRRKDGAEELSIKGRY